MYVMIFAGIWAVISLVAAIWVLFDAHKRGSSGVIWFVIILILGLLGLALWFVVRPAIVQLPPPM